MARKIAVIGGTGLEQADWVSNQEPLSIETPFGVPTDTIFRATGDGAELYFLSRHGKNHEYSPTDLNYRANIYALKMLGVEWCIGIGAVGSLREKLRPGDAVIPDQILDRTKHRESTFFTNGITAHISFADPFCPVLRGILIGVATEVFEAAGRAAHPQGISVCMEGPALSTRAESQFHRSLGGSIIGMTVIPEAKLAREAEIAYASLSLVTDYDCWRTPDADVSVPEILETMRNTAALAGEVVRRSIPLIAQATPSELAAHALAHAVLTPVTAIPPELRRDLEPLLRRYWEARPATGD